MDSHSRLRKAYLEKGKDSADFEKSRKYIISLTAEALREITYRNFMVAPEDLIRHYLELTLLLTQMDGNDEAVGILRRARESAFGQAEAKSFLELCVNNFRRDNIREHQTEVDVR